jgi:hypothetical protein
VVAQLKQSGARIQKASNEIIGAMSAFEPMAINNSLVSLPVDDDIFQIDLAEILAVRRETATA